MNLRIVVSDTSPVRALHHLDMLRALPDLFGEVIVPPAVVAELWQPRRNMPRIEIAKEPWIQVMGPADSTRVESFLLEVDRGEAEAIALAMELRAELLIDERDGRKLARRMGVHNVGALGIMVRAKDRGIIRAVGPLLDRLVNELEFYVSDELRTRVLRQAHEL